VGWGEGRVSWQAVGSAPGWGLAQTGGRDPAGRGSSGTVKGQIFQHSVDLGLEAGIAEDRYPAMCGSRIELWPGTA
jgi:hypothetical protein